MKKVKDRATLDREAAARGWTVMDQGQPVRYLPQKPSVTGVPKEDPMQTHREHLRELMAQVSEGQAAMAKAMLDGIERLASRQAPPISPAAPFVPYLDLQVQRGPEGRIVALLGMPWRFDIERNRKRQITGISAVSGPLKWRFTVVPDEAGRPAAMRAVIPSLHIAAPQ